MILPNVGGEAFSRRVVKTLLRSLTEGEFASLATLPSENELAARYEVSRSVIRDALSALEREGFIRRTRGVGTIVQREVVGLQARFDLKLEYNELIQSMGFSPGVDSVSVRVEPATEEMARRLSIKASDPLIVCEKRLLAGARPVIYSIDRLPLALFEGVPHQALDWSHPVFDLLEASLGFSIDTDIAEITPAMGPKPIREKLALLPDQALLLVDEVGYYHLSRPVFQSFGYYTDFFRFTMLRKRL